MKKKNSVIAIMAAIAFATGWNIYQSNNETKLTDLALNNVEALASGESGGKCTGPKTNGDCESRNTNPCSDTSGCNS